MLSALPVGMAPILPHIGGPIPGGDRYAAGGALLRADVMGNGQRHYAVIMSALCGLRTALFVSDEAEHFLQRIAVTKKLRCAAYRDP